MPVSAGNDLVEQSCPGERASGVMDDHDIKPVCRDVGSQLLQCTPLRIVPRLTPDHRAGIYREPLGGEQMLAPLAVPLRDRYDNLGHGWQLSCLAQRPA